MNSDLEKQTKGENKMFCINCGTKLPDGSKFCSECGTNLLAFNNNSANNSNFNNNEQKECSQVRITNSYTAQDIWKVCCSEDIGAPYCEVGNPLKSRKEKAARVYFEIPQDEKIYMVYDSTVFGSCKYGFAICLSGIFYNSDGTGNGVVEWEEFKEIKINGGRSSVGFLGASFNTGTEGKKLLAILLRLQELISEGFVKY